MRKNRIKLTESHLRRIVLESVRRVLMEGEYDDEIFDNVHKFPEYDIHHSLKSDINRLKDSYDDNLDGIGRTVHGSFINDEGDEDYDYVDEYYPSTPEAKSYYDYANRVGNRSSRRKEDMDADFRELDRIRADKAYNDRLEREKVRRGEYFDPTYQRHIN